MKLGTTFATIIAILALVISCMGCPRQQSDGPEAVPMVVSSHEAAAIEWSADWDAAFAQARTQRKAVLVTFYADWCIWCKRFEDTTLADNHVAAYLADTVVALRLDVDGNGRERSNEYEVDGLPTILLFDAEGREIGRIPGYMPPGAFLEQVRGLLS